MYISSSILGALIVLAIGFITYLWQRKVAEFDRRIKALEDEYLTKGGRMPNRWQYVFMDALALLDEEASQDDIESGAIEGRKALRGKLQKYLISAMNGEKQK